MHITVYTRSIDPNDLELRVARRAEFALGRFAQRIRSLTMRVDDINGKRGGPGIACHAVIRLASGGTLIIKSLATVAHHAAFDAIERARTAVHRAIERERAY